MYRHFFKRFFDITISLLGIIVLSPVFIIVYIILNKNIITKILQIEIKCNWILQVNQDNYKSYFDKKYLFNDLFF